MDRDRVVAAALEYTDRHGFGSLTMRALGQQLGVEAMAAYRYVHGREDLLEAVVNHLLAGLLENLDDQLRGSWQGYLQDVAHAVRRVAVEHPAAFPLVATRHPVAPWLRPPLRNLELVEDFLTVLIGHGFTDEQAARTYRTFSSFLLGQLLLEASQRGASTALGKEPLDGGSAEVGDLGPNGTPSAWRLRPLLSEDRSLEEFEIALESLLDRLEMNLSQ